MTTMTATPDLGQDSPELPDEIELLEDNLRRQLDGHRKLLGCIECSREAVRVADMPRIGEVCREQHEIAQRLAELEKARLTLVGLLTEKYAPRAEQPLSLPEIASQIDSPRRERLAAVGADLKSVMGEVRRASGVVHSAAEALARHMEGLTQTVQAAFGRARVYGRRGRIETAAEHPFCLDIRS